MNCSECGNTMQWRSTNQVTNIAKYKCRHCGNVQEGEDEYKEVIVEVPEPKYYYFYRGRYIVHRMIGGVNRYIGTYADEETAKKVVDKMKEYDWDTDMVPRIHEELGMQKVKRLWVCV